VTERERDVLLALCRPVLDSDAPFTEPASIRRIAADLVVTEAAVKQHLIHLYDKFGLYDETENRRLRLANEVLVRRIVTLDDLGAAPGRTRPTAGLTAGREAAAAGDWETAYEQLGAADRAGTLDPEDLELLGDACFWSERPTAALEIRQRAHAAYSDRGDGPGAARTAMDLAISHAARGQVAVAGGWLATARRLLEGSEERQEHGRLAAMGSLFAVVTGRFEAALEDAERAISIGERFGDRDAVALGQAYRGYALVRLGRRMEGLAQLDEAMARALGGRLGPLATDQVFCRTLGACLDCWDYRRAAEWAEVVLGQSTPSWPVAVDGDCRAHRVAIDIVRGRWRRGEEEAMVACVEAEGFDVGHVAVAFAELGEIRLRSGDLEAAESAFRRAHELGGPAQPGLARLDLVRGRPERAMRSLVDALDAAPSDPLGRAALLWALVESAAEAGDVTLAAVAATELEETAQTVGTGALAAAAACALGTVALARGDAAAAAASFRAGWRRWNEVGAPYEAARARVGIAMALEASGDEAAAWLEREAAHATFERLGARLDARRAMPDTHPSGEGSDAGGPTPEEPAGA
jgi:tetratricopeptide (TPR) repeat protein